MLKVGYFHNVFDHQLEGRGCGRAGADLRLFAERCPEVFAPYLNSLAFRAQGIETEMQWRPMTLLFVRGGYTYLDAVVTQSFSSDAYSNGTASNNPNFPNIAIGAEGPLIGARPFRRPPHTGFFAVQYTGNEAGRGAEGRAGQPLG